MVFLIHYIYRVDFSLLTTLFGDVRLKHWTYGKRFGVARALSLFKEVNRNEKPILLVDGIPIVSRHLDVYLTLCAGFRGYSFCYQ
jgi:hypothetical protein